MLNGEKQKVFGVPDSLTLASAKEWLKKRISEKRFKHTEGVVDTACELARRSGCDEFHAQLAAWLHDCCKEVKADDLIAEAKSYGIVLHPVDEINGHLLHGPVAAAKVRAELGLTDSSILNAIAEHTLGAVNMTLLSKVIFLADALEPGRDPDYCKPIWQALHPCVWPDDVEETLASKDFSAEPTSKSRLQLTDQSLLDKTDHGATTFQGLRGLEALKLTGKIKPDLDKAVLVAIDLGLTDLIASQRAIHPKTVEVRNYYLQIIKSRL